MSVRAPLHAPHACCHARSPCSQAASGGLGVGIGHGSSQERSIMARRLFEWLSRAWALSECVPTLPALHACSRAAMLGLAAMLFLEGASSNAFFM